MTFQGHGQSPIHCKSGKSLKRAKKDRDVVTTDH